MAELAFQDFYPADTAVCYGCGRLNPHGLQIKSHWEGDEAVCKFQPEPYHTAVPGIVYGGLIASLIDCHSTGTAAAAAYRAEGRGMETEPFLRYVTGALHVDYLAPTPIDNGPLILRSRVEEVKGRKIVVRTSLYAADTECARGTVVAIRLPEEWSQIS
jgi:acyl-coenzyme A thioesterase PaaI-like protein